MTDEEMLFDLRLMESFMGIPNKNAGRLVETKKGLTGRTYNHEDLINGKIRVYTDKGKLLCNPETLILKGFID
jgi:hypothetical protein